MAKQSLQEKYNLPKIIRVKVTKSKNGGFTAVLVDYPGCITYADTPSELVENINDAVLTYFEVPRNEAIKADFVYVPLPQKQVSAPNANRQDENEMSEFYPYTPSFSYA